MVDRVKNTTVVVFTVVVVVVVVGTAMTSAHTMLKPAGSYVEGMI